MLGSLGIREKVRGSGPEGRRRTAAAKGIPRAQAGESGRREAGRRDTGQDAGALLNTEMPCSSPWTTHIPRRQGGLRNS